MFFTHFIETIFFLNDYREHPIFNQFSQSIKEREMFSLIGPEKRKFSILYTLN